VQAPHQNELSIYQVEVSLSLLDWQVLAAYPVTSLFPDNGRQKVRWFLRVRPGGVIEDLMTGTEASGLFVEMLYVALFEGEGLLAHYRQSNE
jgi:hypothetical protein